MEAYVDLSGDMMFERRKLSESLKRLESMIGSPEVASRLGGPVLLELQAEIDRISGAILRLESLAKNLSSKATGERYHEAGAFLAATAAAVQKMGERCNRKLIVRTVGEGVRIDHSKLDLMSATLTSMLESFVEFSIEGPKERFLRGKKDTAVVQISVKREGEGVVFSIVADGNGIIPPLSERHGKELALLSLRASFEGRPGRWSCWIIHLPSESGVLNCIRCKVGGRSMYLPVWSVVSIKPLSEVPESESILQLDESFNRISVTQRAELASSRPILEVSAGVRRVFLLTDNLTMGEFKKEETFIKQLPVKFNGEGRYLGIAVETKRGDQTLNVIVNPTYVVYGKEPEEQRKSV